MIRVVRDVRTCGHIARREIRDPIRVVEDCVARVVVASHTAEVALGPYEIRRTIGHAHAVAQLPDEAIYHVAVAAVV